MAFDTPNLQMFLRDEAFDRLIQARDMENFKEQMFLF
jgi:hypothetical protein